MSLERAIEQVFANRLAVLAPVIPTLWNAHTCPVDMLPWLAWAISVGEWDATWPEKFKRDTIADAVPIHSHKGTLGGLRQALTAMGHANAQIIERHASIRYTGSSKFDGTRTYGGPSQWATFSVLLERPVSIRQAALIRKRIASVKRNCCHLTGLDFTSVAIKYNGAIKYDGTYTHGLV